MSMNILNRASTGLAGLDAVLQGLRFGDNVVWQIDDIDDYVKLTAEFVENALADGHNLVYMRFAAHKPVVRHDERIKTYLLDADAGFEGFTAQVHAIITSEGERAFYVFDCLSDLLSAWATDLMIGNFFSVTCPYLFELDTVTYFGIMRNKHSYEAVARIRETTQLLVEVYDVDGRMFVHPLKVWNRYSPTMFLPHEWSGGSFVPVTDSAVSAQFYSHLASGRFKNPSMKLDYWDRLFMQAEELLYSEFGASGHTNDGEFDVHVHTDDGAFGAGGHTEAGGFVKDGATVRSPEYVRMVDKLCRIMIGREEKILSLARRYFDLKDLLDIKSRMIGSGYIGGKAAGMLLARKILAGTEEPGKISAEAAASGNIPTGVGAGTQAPGMIPTGAGAEAAASGMIPAGAVAGSQAPGMILAGAGAQATRIILEPHDSYYVGSDVFYTYLVQNGLWRLRMQQKTNEGYYEAAGSLKEKVIGGVFHENIIEQFQQILEHFGQSPIIIRSSSLLEDSYGNAFAGKYESIFCVNSAPPEKRLEELIKAVKRVYASTMDESALAYRLHRGLDKSDEQMALLIQRVSGARHGNYFFPILAGVGNSYNSYVWRNDINPEAGILRLVYGLGTRAVDRIEGDYPRMVSLDKPMLMAVAAKEEIRQYSQHDMDLLDLEENIKKTISISEIIEKGAARHIETFSECRYGYSSNGKKIEECVLTFKPFLKETDFVSNMKSILSTLQSVYEYPVDIEFTVNFNDDGSYRINLLQCRPLQTKVHGKSVRIPVDIAKKDILFSAQGNFMGGSISAGIDTVIYIVPEQYSALTQNIKYTVARAVGKINADIGKNTNNGNNGTGEGIGGNGEHVAMLITPGRCGTTTPSLGLPVSFAEIGNMAVICEVSFTTAGFMPELSFCTHFFQDLVETGILYAALFRERSDTVFNEEMLYEKENLLESLYPNYGHLKDVIRLIRFKGSRLSLMSDVSSQKLMCYKA